MAWVSTRCGDAVRALVRAVPLMCPPMPWCRVARASRRLGGMSKGMSLLVTNDCYHSGMKAFDALNITDGIAALQRGFVTSAQAQAAGVGRMDLSRLAASGRLVRVCRGVYRTSGMPSPREEAVWAAWLSLEPGVRACVRDPLSHVVSHTTAAWLMGTGELDPEPLTFTSSVRRQVQRVGLRIVRGAIGADEVVTVAGLPCTTASRTVCDLIADGQDLGAVASVLAAALDAGLVPDEGSLVERVDALGPGCGVAPGSSLYEALRRG